MSPISLFIVACVALLAASSAEAQFIHVNGTLYCSSNGNSTIGTTTPVFPNATVEVRCPPGLIFDLPSNSTTDTSGAYRVVLLLFRNTTASATVSSVASNCRLFVLTPVSACNPALPSVGLVSNLRFVRSATVGVISTISYVVATGFTPQS